MSVPPWKSPRDVEELMALVKSKYHLHLAEASVGLCFDDSKPFKDNRLNLGKVLKFSQLNKLWHGHKYDFCIVLCSDVWYSILVDRQREALLDLQLTRCQVEYAVAKVIENGKSKVVKDNWGRVEYTEEFKLNSVGEPSWKVAPLDFYVLAKNIKRYGLWLDDLVDLKDALSEKEVSDE